MERLKDAEWLKLREEADKVEAQKVELAKVFERAPVHFRDAKPVDATMLESHRNIHERK